MTSPDATSRPLPADVWELQPGQPSLGETIVDIWRHRRLLPFLAKRSLQKIYRRTILGWLWLLIIPLFPIVLRTAVFGGLLGVESDGVPYILFLAAGSLIWDLFSLGLTWGTRSLDISGGLVEQTYVPRAIIPIGAMAPALLDFVLKLGAFGLIVGGIWAMGGNPYVSLGEIGWTVAALGSVWLFALGLSFFTTVWGEETADVRIVLGQVLAIWFLMTPVIYPVSEMPESWQKWIVLNPLAAFVETFRWSLFGVGRHDPRAFATSSVFVCAVLVLGLMYFARRDAAANDAR